MAHGANPGHHMVCTCGLIGTQPCPFTYKLSMAVYALQQETRIAVTETIQPTKLKVFTFWLLTEKVWP